MHLFYSFFFLNPDLVESGWIRNTVQCPQCCMLHLQKSGGDLRGFLFHSRIKPKSEDLRSRLDKHKVNYRLSLQTNIFFVCYRSKSRRTLDSDPDPGKNYTFPGLWKLFKNFFTFHLWIHFKNSNSYYESTETTDVYYILIGTFFIKHVLRISPPT